jgi:hypothetical protein
MPTINTMATLVEVRTSEDLTSSAERKIKNSSPNTIGLTFPISPPIATISTMVNESVTSSVAMVAGTIAVMTITKKGIPAAERSRAIAEKTTIMARKMKRMDKPEERRILSSIHFMMLINKL